MKVRLLKRAFIQEGMHEAGEVLDLPDTTDGKPTPLSDHMELVKKSVKPAPSRPVPAFAKPAEPVSPPPPRPALPDKVKPPEPDKTA